MVVAPHRGDVAATVAMNAAIVAFRHTGIHRVRRDGQGRTREIHDRGNPAAVDGPIAIRHRGVTRTLHRDVEVIATAGFLDCAFNVVARASHEVNRGGYVDRRVA